MRAIDQALVDQVWRDMTGYPPGRVAEEARAFLERQPHVAAFVQATVGDEDEAVQKAALGLAFLLFKIVDESLGQPFPTLAEQRIREAFGSPRRRRGAREDTDRPAARAAPGDPAASDLVGYILRVFYGQGGGAVEHDERVRGHLHLLLRTLADALDLGSPEG